MNIYKCELAGRKIYIKSNHNGARQFRKIPFSNVEIMSKIKMKKKTVYTSNSIGTHNKHMIIIIQCIDNDSWVFFLIENEYIENNILIYLWTDIQYSSPPHAVIIICSEYIHTHTSIYIYVMDNHIRRVYIQCVLYSR